MAEQPSYNPFQARACESSICRKVEVPEVRVTMQSCIVGQDRTLLNRRAKHRVLTIQEKLSIMNAIQHGAKKSVLAWKKGLPLPTVCGTWTAREKALNGAPSNLNCCRLRGSSYPDTEEALMRGPKNARAQDLPVSGLLLTEKAQ
ncbi:hypothetical protein HPB52_018292 [Rhipicephalus sanguineus]|uniref:Tick transposon n=1 Tax=Rhipicephalus sanguineus TaxID=34632 RepID=A0A9D4PY83_RHISA|nr:hypothetical protein HPB52_018292 [Rhipicephalus sanguineus]